MCGISGIIAPSLSAAEKRDIIQRMNARLAHRGPDNQGILESENGCFGHCRLSIIDLSPESNQPFVSADGRYSIVYNGELYNYKELRLDLQRSAAGSGHQAYFFRTASDTEVLLAAYLRWGIRFLDLLNGMYAFAIHDHQTGYTLLARDRYGVKPLYYTSAGNAFVFASEMRAILASGQRKFVLNKPAVAEYLMYQTVFAPSTIVKDVLMLMPGHYMEIRNGDVSITRYYKPDIQPFPELSYKETCDKTLGLLAASVNRRMVADVPFGAFLSGGIDSTAVVALMSQNRNQVKTFNVSFDESEFSEAQYAKLVAKKYNTEHHEIRLTPADFLEALPDALKAMDHPSGDGPNTFVVSRAARNAGIKMALSGIGGDELFAGYDVFRRLSRLQRRPLLHALPVLFRKSAAPLIRTLDRSVRGQKLSELLALNEITFESVYPLGRALFTGRAAKQMTGSDPFIQIANILRSVPKIEKRFLSAISIAEMETYLQNVLLRDTDQMSMGVALEVREPFLDHQLIEFVLSVPDDFKFPSTPKKLLTDSLGDLLPQEIVHRPKMGFTLPWSEWLRNEMKSFASLNIEGLERKNILAPGAAAKLWQRFLSGDARVTWGRVWHLIVLNDWLDKNAVEVG